MRTYVIHYSIDVEFKAWARAMGLTVYKQQVNTYVYVDLVDIELGSKLDTMAQLGFGHGLTPWISRQNTSSNA